jgi:hypothetical protein
MKSILLVLFVFLGFSAMAAEKARASEAHGLLSVEIPDLKGSEVCLATTQEAGAKMNWILTCLDSKRKYLMRERKVASEKTAAEDEMTYGDLEITVEMQNRGFRLASTQDGLFFTKK